MDYKVKFDGVELVARFVDEPGCGFAFLEENGDYYETYSSREQEIINLLNSDLDACLAEGWVEKAEKLSNFLPGAILEMVKEAAGNLAENSFKDYMLQPNYGDYMWGWYDGSYTFHGSSTRPGNENDVMILIRVPGLYQMDSSIFTEGDWLEYDEENDVYIANDDGEKMDFENMAARCLDEGYWNDNIEELKTGLIKNAIENILADLKESTLEDGTYYSKIMDEWIDEDDVKDLKTELRKLHG